MNEYLFIARGEGTTDARGKPQWPAVLRLELPPRDAWRLAYDLLKQLEDTPTATVELTLFGALKDDEQHGPSK